MDRSVWFRSHSVIEYLHETEIDLQRYCGAGECLHLSGGLALDDRERRCVDSREGERTLDIRPGGVD